MASRGHPLATTAPIILTAASDIEMISGENIGSRAGRHGCRSTGACAAPVLRAGRPSLTLAQVQTWRKACDGLARSFDDVLRNHLHTLTGVLPW
jgi:hypothetical protein